MIILKDWLQNLLTYLTVPTANATTNAYERDVVGNKSDIAVTTVGVVASIIAYIKGILNQLATLVGRLPTYSFAQLKNLAVVGDDVVYDAGAEIYHALRAADGTLVPLTPATKAMLNTLAGMPDAPR